MRNGIIHQSVKDLKKIVPPRTVMIVGVTCLLFVLALLILPSLQMQSGAVEQENWPEEGDRIDIDLSGTLLTVDGKEVRLEDYEEEVIFLNFWATWCGPCRAEMPSIADLHAKLDGHGLRVLAVTDEPLTVVRPYLKRNPYPFTVLVDESGSLSSRLGIWSIPWTLILDQNRKLVHFHPGAKLWNTPETIRKIQTLLNE